MSAYDFGAHHNLKYCRILQECQSHIHYVLVTVQENMTENH